MVGDRWFVWRVLVRLQLLLHRELMVVLSISWEGVVLL